MFGTKKTQPFGWTAERLARVVKNLAPLTSNQGDTVTRWAKFAVAGIRTDYDPKEPPEESDGFGWVGLGELGLNESGQLPCGVKFVVVDSHPEHVGWIESRQGRETPVIVPTGVQLTLRVSPVEYESVIAAFANHRGGQIVPMLSCAVTNPKATEDSFSVAVSRWSLRTWPCALSDIHDHPYHSFDY